MMNNSCFGGCNNSSNSNSAREKALLEINQISFVIDELRLYLDTHPDCCEALEMFKKYIAMRNELLKSFTLKYGALEGYSIGNSDTWQWNSAPMPWSAEGR